MRKVRFGRTEQDVSAVSLGTWGHGGPRTIAGRPVGWSGADDTQAKAAILRAWDAGITHWDTADVYGDGRSEKLIGACWKEVPRDGVFLATKVGWDRGRHDHPYHPELIRNRLERSLTNLRTDHLDLYYFHHCDFGRRQGLLDDALAAFHRLRDEGKIRFIGLSDWRCGRIMRCIARIDPDVVQCYRTVLEDAYGTSGLSRWVEEHDLGVAFFSPLKHGLLLGEFEGPVTFGAGDHRSRLPEFRDFGLLSRLRACRREVAERFVEHPQPVLHALIGTLLADSPSGCVLIGQRRPEHAVAAARVGEPLSEETAEWVRALYRQNGKPTRARWGEGH